MRGDASSWIGGNATRGEVAEVLWKLRLKIEAVNWSGGA
jgi:hypothetical protein